MSQYMPLDKIIWKNMSGYVNTGSGVAIDPVYILYTLYQSCCTNPRLPKLNLVDYSICYIPSPNHINATICIHIYWVAGGSEYWGT